MLQLGLAGSAAPLPGVTALPPGAPRQAGCSAGSALLLCKWLLPCLPFHSLSGAGKAAKESRETDCQLEALQLLLPPLLLLPLPLIRLLCHNRSLSGTALLGSPVFLPHHVALPLSELCCWIQATHSLFSYLYTYLYYSLSHTLIILSFTHTFSLTHTY